MKRTRWFMRVLDGDRAPWLAAGWGESARDRLQSLAEEVVLLEWERGGDPLIPEVRDA